MHRTLPWHPLALAFSLQKMTFCCQTCRQSVPMWNFFMEKQIFLYTTFLTSLHVLQNQESLSFPAFMLQIHLYGCICVPTLQKLVERSLLRHCGSGPGSAIYIHSWPETFAPLHWTSNTSVSQYGRIQSHCSPCEPTLCSAVTTSQAHQSPLPWVHPHSTGITHQRLFILLHSKIPPSFALYEHTCLTLCY